MKRRAKDILRTGARTLLAVFFVWVGVMHFTRVEMFEAIVPPYLPSARLLVWVSGVFEILGGLGVLVPSTRRVAGFGLMALLVGVFPANLHMAMHPADFPDIPVWGLYLRLPMQLVLLAWVWWVVRVDPSPAPTHVG